MNNCRNNQNGCNSCHTDQEILNYINQNQNRYPVIIGPTGPSGPTGPAI